MINISQNYSKKIINANNNQNSINNIKLKLINNSIKFIPLYPDNISSFFINNISTNNTDYFGGVL